MTRRIIDRSLLADSAIGLIDDIRGEGGNVSLMEGATGLWNPSQMIRSGSLGLDMAIGIGGLPRGKFIEISGEESSGKTTLALHITREAQAAGHNVVYYDSEYALDPTYCTKLGVDLKSLIISQPDHLEQGLAQMLFLMEDRKFDGFMVLDSIPSLLPKSMVVGDVEAEGRRAAMASVYSRVLPRIKKALRDSNATIMMINQTRDAMAENKYQAQTSTPGGKALKFAYDLRFDIKRRIEGSQKRQDDGIDYQDAEVTVIKNKVGSPFKKGYFTIWKDGTGINWSYDVIEAAVMHGGIISDMKHDGGELIKKKGYFSIHIDSESWGVIKEEDPDIEAFVMDLDITNEETGEIENKEVIYIEKYQRKTFIDYVSQFPSLVEHIENQTLKLLDQGAILRSVDLDKQEEMDSLGGEDESSEDNSEDDVENEEE